VAEPFSLDVAMSPYGPEDEIGRLNLITEESRRRIMARADFGRVFDLSVEYFLGMPSWQKVGDPPYQIWMTHTPNGTAVDNLPGASKEVREYVGYSGDAISMYTHCGTHIDTLNHFGYRGRIWNGFTVKDCLGRRHWTVCGAEKQPPIIARGVLLDVAAAKGMAMLPEEYGITPDDLEITARRQGTRLELGDVVIIRTGRMTVWPDREKYMGNNPGLSLAGAQWLVEQGAMVIGADNLTLEQLPSAEPDNYLPVHCYLFAVAGVPIMEVVWTEELAQEQLYEFAFLGAGLKLRGATGAPMRPVALPLVR